VKSAVSAVGTVAVGAVLVAVFGLVLHTAADSPPTLAATVTGTTSAVPGVTRTASLQLATYPDSGAITWRRNGGVGPHPDWVSYGPTTVLQVPAHALISVTIKQYDSGGTIPNGYLAQVHGTLGGTESINGRTVTGISADDVAHTFTINNYPSSEQTQLFVSVPLPAVSSNAQNAPGSNYPAPNIVTFQFVTGSTGTYSWNCEYPCGSNYAGFGGAMSTYGYMSGTLKVV